METKSIKHKITVHSIKQMYLNFGIEESGKKVEFANRFLKTEQMIFELIKNGLFEDISKLGLDDEVEIEFKITPKLSQRRKVLTEKTNK